MYGTVARMRLKAGSEARLQELMQEYEALEVPGYVGSTVYRMDDNPNEIYLTVLFDDRATYHANAQSPEQDARYREMLELLDGEPEWHDGEVVYSG
jgi:antibiotic biosynthesis monooxygenase (ABM) superfamily enzyme